jgi:RNA polymerase sigma-70 factor (TIGR02943 family)
MIPSPAPVFPHRHRAGQFRRARVVAVAAGFPIAVAAKQRARLAPIAGWACEDVVSAQSGQNSPSVAAAFGDAQLLSAIRADMLRFARLQLGDGDEAEDAVQEAFAGALRNHEAFRNQAALKTWMIAILKHKIADVIRQRQRAPVIASQIAGAEPEGPLPPLFDERGMWRDITHPAPWEDPESDINDSQFLAVFDACLNRLPPQQGRVFLMREVIELDTEEICGELSLTVTNVHVILHRARLRLRACLESNWIDAGDCAC